MVSPNRSRTGGRVLVSRRGGTDVVLHVVADEATAGRFLDPRGGTGYAALHVVVLAASFRSLAGLIRSLKHPLEAERRADGPLVRLANGVLVLALCYLQVLLAMSFGALGPNPAKRLHPVVVVEEGPTGPVDRQVFLIRHGEGVIVAFDAALDAIVELPRARFVDVRQPTHTLGQHAVLEHVDTHGSITRSQADSLLCSRPAIAAAELHQLIGTGALHETRPDTYVAG